MSETLAGALRVGPALLYTVAIFVGGTAAGGGAPAVNDKLLHAIAFGGLALVCAPAIAFLRRGMSLRVLQVSTFAASVSIGAALELWQHFLPHRNAELLDLVADAIGAGLVCSLLGWWITWRNYRSSPQS